MSVSTPMSVGMATGDFDATDETLYEELLDAILADIDVRLRNIEQRLEQR